MEERLQRAVGLAGMGVHRRHLSAFGTKPVSRMPSGVEDVVTHVGIEVQAAHRLHHAAGPVDVDAVLPAFTGLEGERRVQCGQFAGHDGGNRRSST